MRMMSKSSPFLTHSTPLGSFAFSIASACLGPNTILSWVDFDALFTGTNANMEGNRMKVEINLENFILDNFLSRYDTKK